MINVFDVFNNVAAASRHQLCVIRQQNHVPFPLFTATQKQYNTRRNNEIKPDEHQSSSGRGDSSAEKKIKKPTRRVTTGIQMP